MNKMYINLGDPSQDGHSISEKKLFETNYTVNEIQAAYKKSCKLTGISFNHNEDYTGTNRNYKTARYYMICTEYDDSTISEEIMDTLTDFHCPYIEEIIDNDKFIDEKLFLKLWWWFVGLNLDGLYYNHIKIIDDIPTINSANLNVQFGYSLYV